MHSESPTIDIIDTSAELGEPLPPWTYANWELFELEYESLFLSRWQLVGHVNDVPNSGDYIAADIGRDSVVVLRGEDQELRAFLNVCRHRASRIFEGKGSCRGVIRCPYHGWTYRFDGSLMAIPQEENFPDLDRSEYGLHEIQIEDFYGLVFVRVTGEGPTVAAQFAHTDTFFADYDVANYVEFAQPITDIWDVNWKVAWDNFLENYHIPMGHPGLNRLVQESGEWAELTSGVSYGVFRLRERCSKVAEERRYQEQSHHGNRRLPEDLKDKWVQFGLTPNLGIDLYPEMLDLFQLIPLAPDKTMVRAAFYGHQDPTPEEEELRRLNMQINTAINEEDKVLCARVHQGLTTHGYEPGPLSQQESAVYNFHEMMRELIPVMALRDEPVAGSVATENARLLEQR